MASSNPNLPQSPAPQFEWDSRRYDKRTPPYRYQFGADQFIKQCIAIRQFARDHEELDAREDECWRMYGVAVEYFMDERIITA